MTPSRRYPKPRPGYAWPAELSRIGAAPPVPIFEGEAQDAAIAQRIRLLESLREHFKIEPGPAQWMLLCLSLAELCVPAFQQKQSRAKWTGYTGGALVVEIERHLADNKDRAPARAGARWSARELGKAGRWQNFLQSWDEGTADPGEALYKQYKRFRKRKWAGVMRRKFKYSQLTNNLDEWERELDDLLANPVPDIQLTSK